MCGVVCSCNVLMRVPFFLYTSIVREVVTKIRILIMYILSINKRLASFLSLTIRKVCIVCVASASQLVVASWYELIVNT